jgi:hypothetical protein
MLTPPKKKQKLGGVIIRQPTLSVFLTPYFGCIDIAYSRPIPKEVLNLSYAEL